MIPRRVVALGVAAALLAGAGIAAAATVDPTDVRSAAPIVATTTTTTTVEPAATTTVVPSTSTTVPPPPTTTTTARRATTTPTRRPASTVAPPQPTSTSTAAPAPTCTPAQIQVTAAASRPSYGPMEKVEVTTVLRNGAGGPCSYNGYTVEFTFRDAAGEAFAGGTVVADTFGPVPLAPGAALTHSETWRHIFQPPGPHTATAVWNFAGHRFVSTAPFQLT